MNNSCKIQLLEKHLEQFYEQQKSVLEQLKFLTLNLNAFGHASPEDQVSGIETNIAQLYTNFVSYANTLNSVLEIKSDRKKSLSDGFVNKRKQSSPQSSTSGHDSRRSHLSEILDQEEDSLTSIKHQIEFILAQLKKLHCSPVNGVCRNYEQLINNAAQALSNNRVIEASQCLQSILFDTSVDSRTQKMHQKIIKLAKEIS